MTKLSTIRQQIDTIDVHLLSLIQERTALADNVVQAKKEMGKAIFDAEREQQVLERLKASSDLSSECIEGVWKSLFTESRKRQGE